MDKLPAHVGRRHVLKTNRTALKQLERQRQAMEMRRAGHTYQKIADALGYYSAVSAARAVQAVLRRTVREPAEEQMIIELDRIDKLISGIWEAALGYREILNPAWSDSLEPQDPDGPIIPKFIRQEISVEDQAKAISKIVQLMERKSKFLGLDAPTKIDQIDKRAQQELLENIVGVITEVAKQYPDAGREILRRFKEKGVI